MDASVDSHLPPNFAISPAKEITTTTTRGPVSCQGRGVPGFGTLGAGPSDAASGRHIPGFAAQPYRDLSHKVTGVAPPGGTVISSTSVPGPGAQDHRECGHTGTGSRGRDAASVTGIPGTNCPRKSPNRMGNPAVNFVLINWSNNTPTAGGRLFDLGGKA
jgi:hypothetical protein